MFLIFTFSYKPQQNLWIFCVLHRFVSHIKYFYLSTETLTNELERRSTNVEVRSEAMFVIILTVTQVVEVSLKGREVNSTNECNFKA